MPNYLEDVRPDEAEMPDELEGAFDELDGDEALAPELEEDEEGAEGEESSEDGGEEEGEESGEGDAEGEEGETDLNAGGEKPEVKPEAQTISQAEYNRLAAQHRLMARDQAILVRRLAELEQGVKQRQVPKKEEVPEEEQIPDFEQDQAAHLKARLDRIEKQRVKDAEDAAKREREIAEAQAFRDDSNAAQAEMNKFRDQNPEEYTAAVNHLLNSWMEESIQKNPGIPSAEIERELTAAIVRTAVRKHRSGENPGEYFYGQAVKYGWKPGSATPAPKETNMEPKKLAPAGDTKSGKYGDGVAKIDKKPTPRQDIRGQLAKAGVGRTLSSVSSAGAAKKPSLMKDLQTPEEEWDSKTKGKGMRQLLSGLGKEGVGG